MFAFELRSLSFIIVPNSIAIMLRCGNNAEYANQGHLDSPDNRTLFLRFYSVVLIYHLGRHTKLVSYCYSDGPSNRSSYRHGLVD